MTRMIRMTRAMRELFGSSGATGKVLTHYGTGVILHDHNPISNRCCVLASGPGDESESPMA